MVRFLPVMKFFDKGFVDRPQLMQTACGENDFPIPVGAYVADKLNPVNQRSVSRISHVESDSSVLFYHLIQDIHVVYFFLKEDFGR